MIDSKLALVLQDLRAAQVRNFPSLRRSTVKSIEVLESEEPLPTPALPICREVYRIPRQLIPLGKPKKKIQFLLPKEVKVLAHQVAKKKLKARRIVSRRNRRYCRIFDISCKRSNKIFDRIKSKGHIKRNETKVRPLDVQFVKSFPFLRGFEATREREGSLKIIFVSEELKGSTYSFRVVSLTFELV